MHSEDIQQIDSKNDDVAGIFRKIIFQLSRILFIFLLLPIIMPMATPMNIAKFARLLHPTCPCSKLEK